jgi:aryl-alcohol dehydrogenase-like predicted oxidoreductase
LHEADEAGRPGAAKFASLQNEYSLLHRDPEAEILPLCRTLGMAFIPYFPLASGMLTGKYRKGQPPPAGSRIAEGRHADLFNEQNLAIVERLIAFSEERGHTILELAFSWLLRRPAVASVIAGATKPEQVKANAAAATWELSDAEVAEVDQLLAQR